MPVEQYEYFPHMDASCLTEFHTLLTSTALHTNWLVQDENKYGWLDEVKSTIPPNHACFYSFSHLSWSAAIFYLHTVTAFCCWLWVLLLFLWEGQRQTDKQRTEGETDGRPPTAPVQIHYLHSRSGHFTAVFTLDPAVSIRWQGQGLQMWLPIHRSTTSLRADPPPHFLIRPLTLLIKKIPVGVFLKTIIHSTTQSQSLI